jgi:biotin operon repressor
MADDKTPDFWDEVKPDTEDENSLLKAFNKQMMIAKPQPGEPRSEVVARSYRFNNGRPHLSDALGVSADQIPQATEELRKHGCTVDFAPDGRAIIHSSKQYKEVAKTFGAWNGKDGFEDKKNPTGTRQQQYREEMKRKIERGEYRHEYDGI